jgi:uncharacterized damage-inducible protein DinB
MLRYSLLLLVAACAVPVRGQDNPLSKEARSDYTIVKNLVIRAAEKVPEAGYSFKPVPEVRSFGQLIGHITDDQYRYCSAVRGENKTSQFEKAPRPKAEMVAALKSAFAYCDTAYEGLVDASATENVVFSGRTVPKLSVFTLHAGHAWEHYGNAVVYMRLQGVVPPSSEKAVKPSLRTPSAARLPRTSFHEEVV